MRKIAHIINPVIVDETSDLFVAQPVTFEAIRIAREFARDRVEVTCFTVQYPEDRPLMPSGFLATPDLERSVLDFGTFQRRRKLPLIKDILDRLYEASEADYLIYSNVDIALMPYFYLAIDQIIESGYDAFVINRRTISNKYGRVDQLYLMFSELGKKHPGYDCFVFDKALYPKFELGTACVGGNWIGRVLVTNLSCHAHKFKVFEDLHLSFHIGDERIWTRPLNQDYAKHNEHELHRILLQYKARGLLQRNPLVGGFLQQIESPASESLRARGKSRAPDPGKRHPATKFNERIKLNKISLPQDPIFVVGFPRSGTTLLQTLLATQEGLYSLPETHYFSNVSRAIRTDENDLIESACLSEVFESIRQMMGLEFPRAVADEIAHMADRKELAYKRFFEIIVFHYMNEQIENPYSTRFRWIEKTPVHFYQFDRILGLYPAAKFVAIIRDPRPTISSNKKALPEWREPTRILAFRWNQMTRILENFRKRHADCIYVLRYEDLVENVEKEMDALCAFLGTAVNLGLLKAYKDKSRTLILPWEQWKDGVRAGEIANTNNLHRTSLIETLIIQCFAQEGMIKFGYPILFPRLQRVFDIAVARYRSLYGYTRNLYTR
jgi:hypothetical protein